VRTRGAARRTKPRHAIAANASARRTTPPAFVPNHAEHVTACASSFIRTLTVGPGIAPDLLTLLNAADGRTEQALAGLPALADLPPVGNFAPP